MTNSHTININGIGPVLFEKSSRAKRVIISVRISKGARVAVPTRTSFKKAPECVYPKREWIQKHKHQPHEEICTATLGYFLNFFKAINLLDCDIMQVCLYIQDMCEADRDTQFSIIAEPLFCLPTFSSSIILVWGFQYWWMPLQQASLWPLLQ